MNIFRLVRGLQPRHLWSLSITCLRHPWYVWPTLKATRHTVRLANTLFGTEHHLNNPANAYRHALWNYLIARECHNWWQNMEQVLVWTEKITALHEAFFPNEPLARAMDLHNNKVGRILFEHHFAKTEEEVLQLLKDMSKQSEKIEDIMALEKISADRLIHLIDF